MVASGIVAGLVGLVRPDFFVRLGLDRSSVGVVLVVASGVAVIVSGIVVVVFGLGVVVLGLNIVELGEEVVVFGTVVVPPGGLLCADGVAT
jgi:hypothetical protein